MKHFFWLFCILFNLIFFILIFYFILYASLQGDNVWKGQFNECWQPGDCVWADVNAATWAESTGNSEWYEAAEISHPADDRAWRCIILNIP